MGKKRSTLGIDELSLSALNRFIEKLNREDKQLKMTSKKFTTSAILYFVNHEINPENYKDSTLTQQISKLRNTLISFIVKQETEILKPMLKGIENLQINTAKDDLLVLKNQLEAGNIDQEMATIETQAILMGLLQVLFDMMEVSEPERIRLERLLQKKGGEYVEKQTASL